MKTLHGIIAAKDGSYTRATIVKNATGWQLKQSEVWDVDQVSYRRHMLFHNGVHLGLESHWIRRKSFELEKYATVKSNDLFTPCVQPFQLQLLEDFFEFNLLGIHPDDVFLCTLPLNLQKTPRTSFLAIYQEELCWKIGLIHESNLIAVFSFIRTDTTLLHTCMSRLERYWSTIETDVKFPEDVYIFNDQNLFAGEQYTIHRIQTPSTDCQVIKAMGVAFCALNRDIPAFTGASKASRSRKHRTALYIFSAALVVFSLITFGTVHLLNVQYKSRINQYQLEYKRILTENKEIRDLLTQGETLAAKLKRIQTLSSQVSNWSQFLHELGLKRPPGLFFERLGSEPLNSGTDRRVRLVMSGWADNETTVTNLIKRLNSSPSISQITLSSMERDNKQKDYCRFKIICTLKLSKN